MASTSTKCSQHCGAQQTHLVRTASRVLRTCGSCADTLSTTRPDIVVNVTPLPTATQSSMSYRTANEMSSDEYAQRLDAMRRSA